MSFHNCHCSLLTFECQVIDFIPQFYPNKLKYRFDKLSDTSLFGPAEHLKRLCAKVPPASGSELTGKLENSTGITVQFIAFVSFNHFKE